ncbi:MAG: peptidase [Hyphomicrobiales bacterium]|nr:peptidase [Hyphomicrobiales bacterium]
MAHENPFFETWATPFGMPPFDRIETRHYMPAFERAVEDHRAEIDAIRNDPAAPTFQNSVEAFERSGADLVRVSLVFRNLAGTESDEAIRAVERDLSPILARHRSSIYLDATLFARMDAVLDGPEGASLDPEQKRLTERLHKAFVRSGARLSETERARLSDITARLATLGTQFSQNVLQDESDYILLLKEEADLAGMSDDFRLAAATLAQARGHEGLHAVSLSRGNVESFLTQSTRADLRETLHAAFLARGERGSTTDNRDVIAETIALREERAKLLGYESYAHYKLDDTMAETPEAVRGLLDRVWAPARGAAARERDRLAEIASDEGNNSPIRQPDWRHYAEKLRRADYAIDDGELRPFFPLDRMIEAAFYVAGRLFGLTFKERKDLPLYGRQVRAFEVTGADGRHVAIFLGDYFARPSKRSGAWMSAFRVQQKLAGDIRPIIINVLNIAEPAPGEQALLSIDEARTLFHEFGHALHGMLSSVKYPSLAGTSVSSDFVELPSQLYEHWLMQPQVLRLYARHVETGEPIPEDLIKRLHAARGFNQGFGTVEYCASAFVDLEMHLSAPEARKDPLAFERKVLDRIGMPAEIAMRHRSPHFTHVFSGEGYASGYYSYLWSEVLDADAFSAFEETGDIFDPATAARLRDFVYAAGNLRDPKDAYLAFRGKLPGVEPLLETRGLS